MPSTRALLILMMSMLLTGCLGISGVWTGAELVYDRHNLYKKFNDYQLVAQANRALYRDKMFKRDDCYIDLAAFNGDLLLVGHVPTPELRDEAYARVARKTGYRRLFNQLAIGHSDGNDAEDSWITAKIRSQIVADAEIDPHQFKVITVDQVVYLMGDVLPEEAARVIQIARETDDVIRVVKLFKYYHLSDKS